jgi:hypothetical protein
MGNSVGHWEGDTLVVETRNLRPESMINREPLLSGSRAEERAAAGSTQP